MDLLKLYQLFGKKELSEEEKKQQLIKTAFNKKNRSHKSIKAVLITFIVSYSIFLSSYLWLPSTEKKEPFVSGVKYELGSITATILRFDYSEEQGIAEMELELDDGTYEKGEYEYLAVQDGEQLEVNIILKSLNQIILQIKEVASAKKQLTFVMGFVRDEDDFSSFEVSYTPRYLTQVKDLSLKTEKEYKTQGLNLKILNFEKEIEQIQNKIKENEQMCKEILQRNEELEKSKNFKTEQEKEEIDQTIAGNRNTIVEVEEEVLTLQKNIEEIKENIANAKRELSTLT